jgi:hypothetical protein
MFISPSFTRMAQVGWKSKFINCCRNVIICLSVNGHFVNFRKTMLQIRWTKLFYWIFAQKMINCQFLPYDIESAKNKCIYGICILKQWISCSVTMYLILDKNDWTFWYIYKSVISSVEVYDNHIITCHFSFHTLYQPSFIYHPYRLLGWYRDLGLIKGMIWKMPCNNQYLLNVDRLFVSLLSQKYFVFVIQPSKENKCFMFGWT